MFIEKKNKHDINEQLKNYLHRYYMNLESYDNEEELYDQDQHYCAKHVYSELYGEGIVVEGAHDEPDENGDIAWYTVEFAHGTEQVYTEDVQIMMAEYHNNHSSKKKKSNKKVM